MAGKLVNQGKVIMLEAFVNKTAPQALNLKLFKNNHTPTAADDETDYTEADFTGYADVELTEATWSATPGTPSTIAYGTPETFASSADQAAQSVYGWYLTQVTSGKLVAAERFSAAIPFQFDTDSLDVAVTITLADTTD